jgi:isopentenyl diphosphate isomerase/L-lactate dehydrogenase-like FMN-dependent dehydrogenase
MISSPGSNETPSPQLCTAGAYRERAKALLSKEIFDYIDGAAGDEITNDRNSRSFDAITLRPLCLRDVSATETKCELLGRELSSPILVGPTAFHQLVNPGGEVATANAAKARGVPMIVSTMSNISLEEIAQQTGHDNLWLQSYIFKQRDVTETLVKRAEDAGYKALVLSAGVPTLGKRHRDIQNQFKLPADCTTGNFASRANDVEIGKFAADLLDPTITWHDVEWLKGLTRLPLLIKGILNPRDAERACELKLAGIVVSNHGGRQLDTSEATIAVLPDIVASVSRELPVLIDGGISRGTDVVKSLALGADAVLLGRPILWALAVDGENGVKALVKALSEDFETAMKLTGCRTVAEIRQFSKDICPLLSRVASFS